MEDRLRLPRVDPRTVAVLAERGIDIAEAHPVRLSAAMIEAAEVVVDLGEEDPPVTVGKRLSAVAGGVTGRRRASRK